MFHVKHEFSFQLSLICDISKALHGCAGVSVRERKGSSIGLAEIPED
jgi:hypothetical protein